MNTNPPELILPPALSRAVGRLPDKDRERLAKTLDRLHAVNALLWAAENRVRGAGLAAAQIADCKREIDQLNAERNALAERADEVLTQLADAGAVEAPVHTETIATAIDRLSVLTLRMWHTTTVGETDEHALSRLPALREQDEELRSALDTLTAEVTSNCRRLPAPARYKLYGRDDGGSAEIAPSRHLQRVIAFGGLSECGKSTSAEYVRQVCGAARFKIGYLLRQAAHRRGLANPYVLSPRRQAELLLDELNRFADAHVETALFTIESVHDHASIAELKALMEDALQIVYLEVPFRMRVARSGTSEQAVTVKDGVKLSRGADRVKELADHVIDNSGSVLDLRARLGRIARPPGIPSLRIAAHDEFALPPAASAPVARLTGRLRDLAPAVSLVALTGSPAEGVWVPGWSDLDLLVVAEASAAEAVASAVEEARVALREIAPMGLTLITVQELTARRLTPRLTYALHRIQHGLPLLFAADHLVLPVITRSDLVSAAADDLPQVMLTMRRLRSAEQPRLRPLYKHLVLACRLLLREHGIWESAPDKILAAAGRLPGLPPLHPPALAYITAAGRAGAGDAALKAVTDSVDQLLAWYALQLAA